MNNIENQLELLGQLHQQTKCPKSTSEIDQAIENAISTRHKPIRWGWYWAAAVIIAIAIPISLSKGSSGIKTVKVGNSKAYFCCNNDCDPESTIELFNSLIH